MSLDACLTLTRPAGPLRQADSSLTRDSGTSGGRLYLSTAQLGYHGDAEGPAQEEERETSRPLRTRTKERDSRELVETQVGTDRKGSGLQSKRASI